MLVQPLLDIIAAGSLFRHLFGLRTQLSSVLQAQIRERRACEAAGDPAASKHAQP
jgi:hypothetical protein